MHKHYDSSRPGEKFIFWPKFLTILLALGLLVSACSLPQSQGELTAFGSAESCSDDEEQLLALYAEVLACTSTTETIAIPPKTNTEDIFNVENSYTYVIHPGEVVIFQADGSSVAYDAESSSDVEVYKVTIDGKEVIVAALNQNAQASASIKITNIDESAATVTAEAVQP